MKTTLAPPLSTAVTYILLALAERDLHGYGIMLESARLSGGEYKIGPTTLYDNLKPLTANGLVREVEAAEAAEDARRLYRLSSVGAGVLADELKRLEQVVKAGRRSLATGPAREA